MFSQGTRVKKDEEETKLPFIYHMTNHKMNTDTKIYHDGFLKIVSIDPAIRNYCIRIENRYFDGKIDTLAYERVDLSGGEELYVGNYCVFYNNLNSFLLSFEELWSDADFIIIERQMRFNVNSTKIMQHTISFFMSELRKSLYFPIIIEVDPKLKNKYLEAPRNLNKNGYKKFTVEKVKEILTERGDEKSLNILKRSKKKDDLADVVAQIEAISIMLNWIPET
jgi:hypothetical protein